AFVLSIYDTYKHHPAYLEGNSLNMLIVGNVVSFIVALLAIKLFIGFLKKYGFRVWGYYRIIVGVILLILIFTGFLK
ncbi:MAG: undecaprenyl-diphosphate phosphatase, partial [Chitinophagaceae bacterium]